MKDAVRVFTFIMLTIFFSSCAHQTLQDGSSEQGYASWYGPGLQGRKTASGERFNMHELTAAHRSLPFGTRVQVSCPSTGRKVTVRINDRGPADRSRLIDLSYQAAKNLGIIHLGLSQVEVQRLSR
jgi:rare lipoprotein A